MTSETRVEEITARAAEYGHPKRPYRTEAHVVYAEDTTYLQERIEELKAENERLRDTLAQVRADTQHIWWE